MTDEERMQEDIAAGIIIPNGMKQVIFIFIFIPYINVHFLPGTFYCLLCPLAIVLHLLSYPINHHVLF